MATNLADAIAFAAEAHQEQKRWNGEPYILHPIRVMSEMHTEEEKIVAILHDVVEDCDITIEYLSTFGYDSIIIKAVDAMTKREDEKYEDYIIRVKENPIARKVKLMDIKDNLNITELKIITERHKDRINKYLWAIERLT